MVCILSNLIKPDAEFEILGDNSNSDYNDGGEEYDWTIISLNY